MARKAKKETKKQVLFNKEADADDHRAKSWPDLPKNLINVIAWQFDLMQDISYGGVTKSWRTQPRQCNNSPAILQRLELYDIGNNDRKFKFSISFHKGEWYWSGKRRRKIPWEYCVGYSDRLLVAKGASPTEYYLDFRCKSIWGGYNTLAPWDPSTPFQRAVITSSPPDRWGNCASSLIVLTGTSHPAFVSGRYKAGGDYEWIKQDCTIAEPHCSNKSDKRNFMRFTNAIGHKGKFYALSLQGTLAVIEDIDSHLRITTLGPKPAVPSVSSRHFRECLLESNGEILLVFLISCKTVNIVDYVEVFQLDIATLSWIKMEKLGDRTLFLGSNCSMSVCASKLGCRRDCVYFSHHTVEGWWVYDFQRGNISQCRSNEVFPQNYTIEIVRTRKRIPSINLYLQE